MEENPGGLACVSANNLTPIKLTLESVGLPGKVTLSATKGGGLIRVWANTNRTEQITLPKTWNAGAQRGALYIEGVATSAEARDVELKLEYDETPQGDNSGLFKCADMIALTVIQAQIAMDGNRDGNIQFENPEDSRYLFWLNDDIDASNWRGHEDDEESGTPNYDDDVINSLRDLEDFTRLHIKVSDVAKQIPEIEYYLQMRGGSPEINVFEAIRKDTRYLQDLGIAKEQAGKKRLLEIDDAETRIPDKYIKAGDDVSPFIIEGRNAGVGDLTLVVRRGQVDICTNSVNLDLRPITAFYDKYVVGAGEGNSANSDTGGNVNLTTYEPDTNTYVLFVHGWRMENWTKDRWAETAFKRLWWQGYKGHFGAFQWPTQTGRFTYNNSELIAWRSADALKSRLRSLDSDHPGEVRVLAHSMGNVVVGEALHLSGAPLVHTYVAAQAAIPAHMYDGSVATHFNRVSTPHIYAFYDTGLIPSTPYLVGNTSKTGQIYSYYNPRDSALGWWNQNNRFTKPNRNYVYHNGDKNIDSYLPGLGDRFYMRLYKPRRDLSLILPDDRYVVFARLVESRSQALGRVTVSGFTGTWDLSSSGMGYNGWSYSHSRQFRSNIVDEWLFWEKFIADCGL